MMRWGTISVAIIGSTAVLLVAQWVGMTSSEGIALAIPAVLAAVCVAALAAAVLGAVRVRSVATQVVLVALCSVTAVAMGAGFAAKSMFFHAHDIGALMVILVAAATVGILFALVLGHRLATETSSIGEAARRIGEGREPGSASPGGSLEFRSLSRELEIVSRSLAEARAKEQAVDRSRRELVAWVSHDLRTPLAGIRAMAEALEDGVVNDSETVRRYHRTMRVEVDRLADLVDDLFELSRINSGTLRLHVEAVSLTDLVSDALAAAAALAQHKGVRLEGRATGDTPEVQASAPEMARVLRNLLENAIRHTPSEGSVCIQTGKKEGLAFVSVEDECGGIPNNDIDRVFELAFRGEASRTPDDHGGGGLGLAIARGIVEAHSGQIDVSNKEGGCRFTIHLPLEQSVG